MSCSDGGKTVRLAIARSTYHVNVNDDCVMTRPNLSVPDVEKLVPTATDISAAGGGGQKSVFRAMIGGEWYAIKFARAGDGAEDIKEVLAGEAMARARREVETMRDCGSPCMVKLGPLGLQLEEINGERVLFFSEEFIDGEDLSVEMRRTRTPFSEADVIKLGIQIGSAIKALWDLGKVHRDIKPPNIMRRGNGDFVLLDAGFAFDVQGESLSVAAVGTPKYFSPEQFQFNDRRTLLDFRSDLFSLGVTMYEMGAGRHPFWVAGDASMSNFGRIMRDPAPLANTVNPLLSAELSEVIARTLGKSPHLRFRRCDQFIDALKRL